MNDSDQLLSEGRRYQYEERIRPPVRRPPSMVPWVVIAGALILISLGIEIFWPLPGHHGRLPMCQSEQSAMTSSCEKPNKTSDQSIDHGKVASRP